MAIAIMCSGGDAPGMNPAIKKFVDYSEKQGLEPYCIYDGLEGLIDGNIKRATHSDVSGILYRGGTILRSSRSKRFFDYAYRKQAYENLKKFGINKFVVLGGDGSFRAMKRFCGEFDFKFAGIPTTIDNDIYGTDYCLGVDTALNVIRDSLDNIRDTASSFNRAFVIEVMGRDCGYLAVVSAITSGAEICVIPEVDFAKNLAEIQMKQEIARGRRYIVAVVAEGTGKTREIAEWLEKGIGMETRVSILGHIQRGGSPTVHDRMMAFEFVVRAVNHLEKGSGEDMVIVYRGGSFSKMTIDEVVNHKYQIDEVLIDSLRYLD